MLKGEGERGLEDSSLLTSISCSSVVSEEPLSRVELVNLCPENLQPHGVFPPTPKSKHTADQQVSVELQLMALYSLPQQSCDCNG